MSDDEKPGCNINFGGFGCLLAFAAAVVSWFLNHSIWWAILHFICGPFYLAYKGIEWGFHVWGHP